MKKIVLFMTLISVLSINTASMNLNEEENQQFQEWVNRCESMGESLSDSEKESRVKRIKAINTPEYKAKEKQERIMYSLRLQIAQLKIDEFAEPSYVDYKRDMLNSELIATYRLHRSLADVACSTPFYKEWEKTWSL